MKIITPGPKGKQTPKKNYIPPLVTSPNDHIVLYDLDNLRIEKGQVVRLYEKFKEQQLRMSKSLRHALDMGLLVAYDPAKLTAQPNTVAPVAPAAAKPASKKLPEDL